MPNPIIHIGLAKTGTTSLQVNVLSDCPDIMSIVFHPDDPDFARFLHAIRGRDSFEYDQAEISGMLERLIEKYDGAGKQLVASDEFFTVPYHPHYTNMDRSLIAKRLFDTFGPSTIVLVLRQPIDLFGSMFLQ